MSYYHDDQDIADERFNGETVPGMNTVPTSKNTRLKTKARDEINRIRGSSTNATDVNNELKDLSIYLYLKGLDGLPVKLSKQIPEEFDYIIEVMTRHGAATGGGVTTVPVYNHDPQDGASDDAGWHDDMG